MFEYTALVDAPVQRFTGIVTGAEPLDEQITLRVEVPAARILVPVAETPVMLVAVEPEPFASEPAPIELAPIEREPIEPAATPAGPTAPGPTAPVPTALPVRTSPPRAQPARLFVPRAEPVPALAPSIVPALIGIAAAGITAFWWLRRDAHSRGGR
jgi:hypothetical protein